MVRSKSPFLDTLSLLREEEYVIVFSDIYSIPQQEIMDAADYLETEFENERLEFLSDQLPYDREAAVWAAKLFYHALQLYLIRGNTGKNLEQLIPQYKGEISTSSLLSADLTLRFLPQLIIDLKTVDAEDPLVKMLEDILMQFHYSAVGYDLDLTGVDWQEELKDETYKKLYLERIVEKKAYHLGEIPYINRLLAAGFGLHKNEFWQELTISNEENE